MLGLVTRDDLGISIGKVSSCNNAEPIRDAFTGPQG